LKIYYPQPIAAMLPVYLAYIFRNLHKVRSVSCELCMYVHVPQVSLWQ